MDWKYIVGIAANTVNIQVNKPNKEGCYKILRIQTDKMPVSKSFDVEYFSTRLIGFTGAEIAFVAREAAYNCLRRKLDTKMSNRDYQFDNLDLSTFIVNEEDFMKSLTLLSNKNNN
jgi:transitional endoplasmic reticulum ATPase